MLTYQPINMPVFLIGGFQRSTRTLKLGSLITKILKDYQVSLVEEIEVWGTEITAAALFCLVYDQPIVPKKGKGDAAKETHGMLTREGKKEKQARADRKRKAIQTSSKDIDAAPKKIRFVSKGKKAEAEQGQYGPKSAENLKRQVEPEEEAKEDTPETPLRKKSKKSSELNPINAAPIASVISEDSHFMRSQGIDLEKSPADQEEELGNFGGQFHTEETVDVEQVEEQTEPTAKVYADLGLNSSFESLDSIPTDPSPPKAKKFKRLKKKAHKSPVIDLLDDSPLRDPITELTDLQFKFFSKNTEPSLTKLKKMQSSVSQPKEHADSTATQGQVHTEQVLEVLVAQHTEIAKEKPAQVSSETLQPPQTSQLQPDSEQLNDSTNQPLPHPQE
ncbi:uncharacterized protein [Euphorbia lathyris]|uniref:uncharacterized protein n=1 Tax=Euphorbia lathyris TaxID=212925 RepID=UPI0033143F00